MLLNLIQNWQVAPAPSPGPSPIPRPPGGGGGSGPGIDLSPIVNALNPAKLLDGVLERLAEQLNQFFGTVFDGLWHSGTNVFTHTPPELTYNLAPVHNLLLGMQLLIGAITAVGVVLAACSLAGRQVFGWGHDLGEHLGRLGLAAVLANGSFFITKTAIDWNNLLCDAIGFAPVPRGFTGFITDPLTMGVLTLIMLWFGLQLGLKMLYRIGMLWVLIATGPLALGCWAIPQAQWVATTWARQFFGWTFGQVLVTIALKIAFANNPFGTGGPLALIFAVALAALAVDLVDLLVYGSTPRFSPVRAIGRVLSLARLAGSIGGPVSAAALTKQRRLPGF